MKFEDISIGNAIKLYIELRDTLSEERKKFKELEANIKSDMNEIESLILEKQRELGLTSLSVGNFTAFQTTKKYVRVNDWDTFIDYIINSGNTQLLEKRVAKLAALEVFDEGIEPHSIGLDKQEEIAIQIRR